MSMKQISSKNNPIIKELKSLQQKKYRKESGLFLIEGFRLVYDAVKNGQMPETLIIQDDKSEKFTNLISLCENKCEIILVPETIIDILAMTDSPEGVLATVKIPESADECLDNKLVLVLDGVQDPGNLGTIIRTANSAGVKGIYMLGNNVDVYNPKVVRSAMGAIFFVKIHYFANAVDLFSHLRQNGYSICVTTLSDTDYYTLDLPKKIALVMGNEGNGVSNESIENADHLITLPMDSKAESLNVAVCTGILVYDILFRR